jgi:hypothetical protein
MIPNYLSEAALHVRIGVRFAWKSDGFAVRSGHSFQIRTKSNGYSGSGQNLIFPANFGKHVIVIVGEKQIKLN